MFKGIHLTLLIGPVVPVPAPKVVVEALTAVEVNSSTGKSGFQLTFSVGKTSPLVTSMLPAGYFDPMVTRVIIVVTVRGIPNVLMDGMVTRQEVSPGNEPGQSTLTITGEDLSILMDVIEMSFMRYAAMPVVAQMNVILAKYAVFGIAPVVVPPIFGEVPSPIEKIPTQTGTDLAYIQEQAGNYGYVFYIEPGPAPGANIAYWGPDIRIPIAQPALNVNMDAHTNVESLSFSLDGLKKKILVLYVFDPLSKKLVVPIPVPNVSLLRPPLGARLTVPSKLEFSKELSKLSAVEAAGQALGQMAADSDAISGSGSLDVLRYGRVLKARQVVGVRGASIAYDGLYFVNSVTHNIKRGEYKQSFNLSRDGLISQTPMVAP